MAAEKSAVWRQFVRSNRVIRKYLFRMAFLAALGVGAAGLLFAWLVIVSPGEAIRQENIEKLLAVESPVYYSDGTTKVGVFFQQSHRQYVPYEKIPREFVNALIAAEDRNFYEHYGVDVAGILRAMVANLKAGRVVQGGSTITQQTAKNLFKRKDRSLLAKLKELLYAWRLEYHYPKEKILEFYANQFYVSGNGRGLGVAARYYFDKQAEDLDLLECVFIAGSVKRPNYYNPFTKADEKLAATARQRAKDRTAYVLGQMYKLGTLSAAQYQQQLDRAVPFKQGQMYYTLNTIMDLVKGAMESAAVEEALSVHGIDNVATSGVRVYTTVDKELQESATSAMRKELSRLDVQLRGYDHRAMQAVYAGLPFGSDYERRRNGFLIGRIVSIAKDGAPSVGVSFEREEIVQGRVDRRGLLSLAGPLARFTRNRWAEPDDKDIIRLLGQLQTGDLVFVSIRDVDNLTGEYLLDLEKYPLLQGGILALKEGTIRAMVGGVDNRHYNRAIAAKRPVGSVMKPLVYAAALQLGWNTVDPLNNQRNVFVYQNKAYFPRPDHDSPHRWISMNWAGVHSENVASVWLLYHLCDQLVPAQLAEVADGLGLGMGPDESYQQYTRRIRDELGVLVNRDALRQAAFEKAVALVEPDLLFGGRLDEYEALKNLHYGARFDQFMAEVEQEFFRGGASREQLAEGNVRREVLQRSFLRFMGLRQELARLAESVERGGGGAGSTSLYLDHESRRVIYAATKNGTAVEPVGWQKLHGMLQGLDQEHRRDFWGNVLIDGVLSAKTVQLAEEALEKEYGRLEALPPYSKEVLLQVRDFKLLVALKYLIGMCRALGIESQLDPVLSFPLGSNVISMLEVARAYEGLRSGALYVSGESPAEEGLAVISRIENSDGEVIYEPARRAMPVLSPRVALAVSDILRNVVRYGTGQFADGNIRLRGRDPEREAQLAGLDLKVPVFGKTGTANRFTNAAFAGFVPGRGNDEALSPETGYALAAYVGFDDNTPMARKTMHITGSSGALPMWTSLANAIVLAGDFAAGLDLADLSFAGVSEVPLADAKLGQVQIAVDDERGGMVSTWTDGRNVSARVTTFGRRNANGEFEPARFFEPYWRSQEN